MNNINPKNTNHRTKTRTKTIQPYSRHSHKKTNTKKNINKHQNKEKEEEKKGEINKNGYFLGFLKMEESLMVEEMRVSCNVLILKGIGIRSEYSTYRLFWDEHKLLSF